MSEPTVYEVWVKTRPLTVQERGEDGATLCWHDAAPAIARAKQLAGFYPNIDFIVREVGPNGLRLAFDSSAT